MEEADRFSVSSVAHENISHSYAQIPKAGGRTNWKDARLGIPDSSIMNKHRHRTTVGQNWERWFPNSFRQMGDYWTYDRLVCLFFTDINERVVLGIPRDHF